MNDWDKDNLNFLLNTKGDEFNAFWAQADMDDRIYAQELLDAYSKELNIRSQELDTEAQVVLQENNGFKEANAVLDKFRI